MVKFSDALRLIREEYERATANYGPFKSVHEGYGILLEELDELWDAVKLKHDRIDSDGRTRRRALAEEGVQTAAMALRFLVDCCELGES